jgi:hypothetical protein
MDQARRGFVVKGEMGWQWRCGLDCCWSGGEHDWSVRGERVMGLVVDKCECMCD